MVSQTVSVENIPERVSVARYTAGEVHQHFQALYDSLDFKAELEELGLKWYQFSRRKKALREFKVLSIALWSLALRRSFPQDAEAFFGAFREQASFLQMDTEDGRLMQTRLNIYVDLLKEKGDTDFLPVAAYFADIFALASDDMNRLRLKLSLLTRTLYNLIFDRLV